jgi:hypothetical protein
MRMIRYWWFRLRGKPKAEARSLAWLGERGMERMIDNIVSEVRAGD